MWDAAFEAVMVILVTSIFCTALPWFGIENGRIFRNSTHSSAGLGRMKERVVIQREICGQSTFGIGLHLTLASSLEHISVN